MRRTSIVATLGPASSAPAVLERLIDAGVDVVRLNFSHGTHAEHRTICTHIRRIATERGRTLAVLADLCGPKIRTGRLQGGEPVDLISGRPLVITTRDVAGTAARISTTYKDLPRDVKPRDRILLSDGVLALRVERVRGTDVHCTVELGGVLGERKGINLPGVKVSAPSLTRKDRQDLRFALDLGADYVALSFVRTAGDVRDLRAAMKRHGRVVPIIAKIEKPEALDDLDRIVECSDGVMVARGDLGVELSAQDVPAAQKEIIACAQRLDEPVITATQMLESMVRSPVPTRAEASDVANAIFDGTDAVMLSGETAVGDYPVEAVRMMAAIAEAAERSRFFRYHVESSPHERRSSLRRAMVHAAVLACHDSGAKAIVVYTASGRTAWYVCRARPRVPIVALTPSLETCQRMALYWGVTPVCVPMLKGTDRLVSVADEQALALNYLKEGDLVVMLTGTSPRPGVENLLKFHRLGGAGNHGAGEEP